MPIDALTRRAFVAGLVAMPVLAACGGGGDDDSSDTTDDSDTTSTSEATTTTAPPVVAPLTGAVFTGDPAVLARPALVVKIDNADGNETARPQAGLNQADVVFEERVEGSVTRLAAVFHSQDADPIGPIRSFRTTDLEIVSLLANPLFAWSGANEYFAELARNGPLIDLGYDVATEAYYRDGNRRAPHNLMSSTVALYALTPAGATPPPALFTYRTPGTPPAGGRPVADVRITYGSSGGSAPVNYQTDAASGRFVRLQKDTPHLDEAGIAVNVDNVVIMFVDYVDSGAVDSSGAPVPQAQLTGGGTAWVLTGGQIVEGSWSRGGLEAPFALTDVAGAAIALAPGRTWVALPDPGGAVVVA